MIIRQSANLIKSPKSLCVGIKTAGNEPLTQTYDAGTGDWIPDRSLIPLTLVPEISSEGTAVAASDLSDWSWVWIKNDGTEEQISSTTTGLSPLLTGYPAGLRVALNATANNPIKLRFECRYGNTRGMAEITLRSVTNAAPAPELHLDFPLVSYFNPFDSRDLDKVTITPRVVGYNHADLSVKWMKKDGNTIREIDYTDPKDIELSLGANDAMTVDRRWMGEEVVLYCRLMKGTTTKTMIREIPVTIRRRIPKFDSSLLMANTFGEETTSVFAELAVVMSGKRIADPSQELLIGWYEGNTNVGNGNSHTFPVKGKEKVDVGYSVDDRGCLKLFTFNGAYLTFNGNYIGGR